MSTAGTRTPKGVEVALDLGKARTFREAFAVLFDLHFERLFRYLDRSSGDPELAADLAQEAFLRLYRRGKLPEKPGPWLISVAMNLLRNAKSKESRRSRLMTRDRATHAHSDSEPSPSALAGSGEVSRRVRGALDRMSERERGLLLLRSQGYSYHDLAEALGLAETSVGTLLARAKDQFRRVYQEVVDAS